MSSLHVIQPPPRSFQRGYPATKTAPPPQRPSLRPFQPPSLRSFSLPPSRIIMINTRSRSIRHANGSPFKSPLPIRRRRPRMSTTLETGSCTHIDQNACSCGTSRRPTDGSLFANGIINSTNNISEKFLLTNLRITQGSLDFLLCSGWAFKNCLTEAVVAYGPTLDLMLSNRNTWDLIDSASPVAQSLILDVAKRMGQLLSLNDLDLSQIVSDPYPVDTEEASNDISWKPVESDIIDLYTGIYDMKKYEAKQFTCTFLVPNFLRFLASSPELQPLWAQIMAIPAPMRGYLSYLLLKAKFSVKKQQEWREHLRARELKRMQRDLASMRQLDRSQQIKLESAKIQEIERMMRAMEEKQKANDFMVKQIAQTQTSDQAGMLIMGQDLRHQQAELSTHQTQLHGHEGQLEHIQQDLRHQQAELSTHQTQLHSHEGQLEHIQQDLRHQQAELSTHQMQLHSHEGQLEDIQQDTRSLVTEAVSAFQSSLDVKFAVLSEQFRVPELDTVCGASSPGSLSHDTFLRLRSCTEQVDELTAQLDGYRRVWTAGEDNRIVSRAVTTCLNRTTTFIIAVMGYSGGGKSYTAFGPDGLLAALLERLPPVFIEVTEVLERRHSIGSYVSTDHSAAAIGAAITESRHSAATIANPDSSRAHLVIRFEDRVEGTLYGILIDIAGPEQSENMAQLDHHMGKDSMKIGNDNIVVRQLLKAIGTAGDVRVLRRASKLNTVVEEAYREGKTVGSRVLALRVVLCGDGSSKEMAGKTMAMVPEFCN